MTVTETNAEVHLVDDPTADSIFISLDCVKPCYPELPDIAWTGHTTRKERKNSAKQKNSRNDQNQEKVEEPYTGPITRSRSKSVNSTS